MRVGVIRNDLSAPILAADLEQVSRRNTSVDPPGQATYLSYPTVAAVEAALADPESGAGATAVGSALSLPVTITLGSNDVLRLSTTVVGDLVNYTIPPGAYATVAAVVAAVNSVLGSAPIRAFDGGNTNLVLESRNYGVASSLILGLNASGSTANATLGFAAGGATRNMPAASVFIAGVGLPGGPLNLSQANVEALGAGNNSRALEPYYDSGREIGILDVFAKLFADTDVAIESALVGMLSGFASASFNPDPRDKSVAPGAAIAILDSDGSAFSQTLPTIASATLGSPLAGAVTIAGTGLGKGSGNSTDPLRSTVVKFTGSITKTLPQEVIEAAGGTVEDDSIVVPASLIPGAATATTSVRVFFRQLASDPEPLA